jgi:nitroreductase
MVRSFTGAEVDGSVLAMICDDALRAPTAGNAQGTALVVLTDPDDRDRYFEAATDETWRTSARRAPGLMRAGAIVLVLCSPARYVARYAEDDKAQSGLGAGHDAWPVPYWFGDAGMVAMSLLLGVADAGLGAAFHGAFRNVGAIRSAFNVPDADELFATILIGHPDGLDHRSPSLNRSTTRSDRLHFGRFA